MKNKVVYRVCKNREKRKILKNNFKRLGEKYPESSNKHMHFFATKDDALRVIWLSHRFLCAYEIPEDKLISSKIVSKYIDRRGYHKLEDVEEYEINSKDLGIDNLVSIEEMSYNLRTLGYEESNNLQNGLKVLYKKK